MGHRVSPVGRRSPGPVYRALERLVLGAGMSLVALAVERRLLRAVRRGHLEPAPRPAADAPPGAVLASPAEGRSPPPADQVEDQAGR